MRLLIDTHALLWWTIDDPQLSRKARSTIMDEDTTIIVSAASAWEIATKFRLGKLPSAAAIAGDVEAAAIEEGFDTLAVSMRHAQLAGTMQGDHGDPFDRMLAAQAQLEGLPIISGDRVFDGFGVKRLW
ncbi:MAG: type II toxin-antitoxin system VapC family toxin [Alphaproteobacteria bacterium]|nr:type II toxin-antitoxin system VapC family toxin [Alphaproteobacteria bacterium]